MQSRVILTALLALTLGAGCKLHGPTGVKQAPKPKASTTVTVSTRPVPLSEVARVVDGPLAAVALTGKVKLISDKGSGVISNNTGNLVSNNSGNLVSNNAGNVLANNGGNFKAQARYTLQAASEENLLGDAQIEVLDGAGRVLVDARKKAITAQTDAEGRYALRAELPQENLVLRIRLFNGGQLFALLPHAESGARTLDISTASSLGAAYVLNRYVQQRQAVLDKLPASEAGLLLADVEAARAQLPPGAPSYLPEEQVSATEALRAKVPALHQRLEQIKALLLAGQVNNGEGLDAIKVALSVPFSAVRDAQGQVFIAESGAGRIRKIDAAGRLTRYAGGASASRGADGDQARSVSLDAPGGMIIGPDGALYFADFLANRVRKILPDGRVFTIAGNGAAAQGATPGKATDVALSGPMGLALAADGSIYISEATRKSTVAGRILRLTPDGMIDVIPSPDIPDWAGAQLSGVTVAADGTIYVAETDQNLLLKRSPRGEWSIVAHDMKLSSCSGVAVDTDGSVYVSEFDAHRILRFSQDGTRTVLAGTGVPGFFGDGGAATSGGLNQPAGLWLGADRTLYVGDSGNGMVRTIDLAAAVPSIRTLAGTQGLTQQGTALGLSINSPGGVAIDAAGRIVVAEVGSSTIKRLEGETLKVIVGTTKGSGGDGGPATSALINTPAGIAFDGPILYVLEAAGFRIRRIDENNIITTIAGNGAHSLMRQRKINALQMGMGRPVSIAIGPDHKPYWTDNENNQIVRLNLDGEAEVVAGALDGTPGEEGDGGPAAGAKLSSPFGLAFSPDGTLYFTDTGNFRVRKITGLDGPTPLMQAAVGLNSVAALAKLLSNGGNEAEGPASEALLMGPTTLCFDPAGAMYVTEAGTSKVQTLGNALGFDVDSLTPIASRIRKFTPDGRYKTIAGPGTALLNDPDSDNSLLMPLGIAIDGQGRLVIADSGNNQIKVLPKGSF